MSDERGDAAPSPCRKLFIGAITLALSWYVIKRPAHGANSGARTTSVTSSRNVGVVDATPKVTDSDLRAKHTITVATEELRTRWAELVTLQTEMNRWRSLYLAALIAGLAWLFTQNEPVDTVVERHPQLLAGLGLVNALFAVWTTFNVWSIHQIGLYCYVKLGDTITARADARLVTWDEWRRDSKMFGLDLPRAVFAAVAALVPAVVTGVFFYWALESRHVNPWIVRPALAVSAGLLLYVWWVTLIEIPAIWRSAIDKRKGAEAPS